MILVKILMKIKNYTAFFHQIKKNIFGILVYQILDFVDLDWYNVDFFYVL